MSSQEDALRIERAAPDDAAPLAELFDAYREFYRMPSDPAGSRRFVDERLAASVTQFLVARDNGEIAGFAHLLPSFDTLAMRPTWILEDFFIRPAARRRGIGGSLLAAVDAFARETHAARLSLTTAHGNRTAQRLYERHGWAPDEHFRQYHRQLG